MRDDNDGFLQKVPIPIPNLTPKQVASKIKLMSKNGTFIEKHQTSSSSKKDPLLLHHQKPPDKQPKSIDIPELTVTPTIDITSLEFDAFEDGFEKEFMKRFRMCDNWNVISMQAFTKVFNDYQSKSVNNETISIDDHIEKNEKLKTNYILDLSSYNIRLSTISPLPATIKKLKNDSSPTVEKKEINPNLKSDFSITKTPQSPQTKSTNSINKLIKTLESNRPSSRINLQISPRIIPLQQPAVFSTKTRQQDFSNIKSSSPIPPVLKKLPTFYVQNSANQNLVVRPESIPAPWTAKYPTKQQNLLFPAKKAGYFGCAKQPVTLNRKDSIVSEKEELESSVFEDDGKNLNRSILLNRTSNVDNSGQHHQTFDLNAETINDLRKKYKQRNFNLRREFKNRNNDSFNKSSFLLNDAISDIKTKSQSSPSTPPPSTTIENRKLFYRQQSIQPSPTFTNDNQLGNRVPSVASRSMQSSISRQSYRTSQDIGSQTILGTFGGLGPDLESAEYKKKMENLKRRRDYSTVVRDLKFPTTTKRDSKKKIYNKKECTLFEAVNVIERRKKMMEFSTKIRRTTELKKRAAIDLSPLIKDSRRKIKVNLDDLRLNELRLVHQRDVESIDKIKRQLGI